MVKAILFDFWGTLAENGIWSPIKQVKNILEIDLPFSEYVVRMEQALMTSKFTDLKEAFLKVCAEFSVSPDEDKIEQLVGLWNKSWMLAQPYPEVKEILGQLKEKYKLILISNTDCFSINKVLDKFELKSYFDRIFLSYELGVIKTDKNFLKHVLSEMNLDVNDCILVGDSIQSDIIPAKRLGMNAVLIDRKNTRDFHPKMKDLKELEKVLGI
ncbi:MAG TPA: HAD family hydrolase [Candidatus Nanoarchaeia archaeon]|nr:HAD family hydrolase [Candidatus Nanoarchaeia archaeon]